MPVIWALIAAMACAPARAVTVEVPAEEAPIPALPAPALTPGSAAFPPEFSAADDEFPRAPLVGASVADERVQPIPAATAAKIARPGQNNVQAPGARAEAEGLVAGFAAPGGAAKALTAVFDGNFKKGSIEAQLVAPMPGRDGRVDLSKIATDDTGDMTKKKVLKALEKDKVKLDGYQQRIFADKKNKILIVLQGMDTGGKDGIIKHVLKGLNPQGFKITGFKKPTAEEASHEPLWRIKKALGGPGMITVFNRSHYEDILVPLAKKTLSRDEIEKRIEENNAFEKQLVDDGWTVVKLFLHVSNEKNWERLEERRTNKKKKWKLSADDIVSRAHWPQNQDAYAYTIGRTNTPYAPWFIIPSDKKWYRNYAAGRIIRRALKRLHPRWPKPKDLPKRIPR